MKALQAFQVLNEIYHPLRNNTEAAAMAAYMKNHFDFLGIKKPIRAAAHKAFMSELVKEKVFESTAFIEILWNQPEREYHYFAMEFAEKKKIFKDKDTIDFIEWLIINQSWWDSVDTIATHLVGKYFLTFPNQVSKVVPRWIVSENMWLNRVAIIYQLAYKEKTNVDVLVSAILPHEFSKEFFHRKAIGWALRQYARTDKKFVEDFVKSRSFSGLTVREALKHIA